MGKRAAVIPAVSALLGAWLIVAPATVLEPMFAARFWNDIIIGTGILVVSGYSAVRAWERRRLGLGAVAFIAALSVWLVVAPFALGATSQLSLWNNVIVGTLVTGLVGYAAYRDRATRIKEVAAVDANYRQ